MEEKYDEYEKRLLEDMLSEIENNKKDKEDYCLPKECAEPPAFVAASWPATIYPEQVRVEDAEGNAFTYIFPEGSKAFAEKYNAEVISVEFDGITYFAEGKWQELGGSTPNTPSNPSKLRPV